MKITDIHAVGHILPHLHCNPSVFPFLCFFSYRKKNEFVGFSCPCNHRTTMDYEITENVCIYCFVSVSTILLWVSSLLFLPDDWVLHRINFMGILCHFMYYLYDCRMVRVCHMLYMIGFTSVHYMYIFQIGFYVFYCIVAFHIILLWIILYTYPTPLFLSFFITSQILTRNLYIATYLLLSHVHPIFYFSDYSKTR
jgi:hypothetical protein